MRKSPLLALSIIFLGLVILFNIIFFIQRSRRLADLSGITTELVLNWSKVQFYTLNLLSSEDIDEAVLDWSGHLQHFKENFELLSDQREILKIKSRNREIAEISEKIAGLWQKAEGEYIDLIASLYHVTESFPDDSPLNDYSMILWPHYSSSVAARYYGEMISSIRDSLILDRNFETDILRMRELIDSELGRLQKSLLRLTVLSVTILIGLLFLLLFTQFQEIRSSRDLALSLSSLLTENPDPVLRVSYGGDILQKNIASQPFLEHWGVPEGRRLPEKLMGRMEKRLAGRDRAAIEVNIGDKIYLLTIIDRPVQGYRNIYGSDITQNRNLENQLRQSQKMDAIGQLAGGIAHDFNNLLSGIMASAQLIEMERDNWKDILSYTDTIVQSCDQAAGLTSKLLAFSRKEQREFKEEDIFQILENTLTILERTLDKRVKMSLENRTDNAGIYGDKSSLQSVFINLAINASHAMPGGGSIDIRIGEVELDPNYCQASLFDLEPGRFCIVEFQDTGTGIPEDHLNKIFDPFFTTKEKGKGTGLGLSTVFGIISQHQGAIEVSSEMGKGTLFRIYLPLKEKTAKAT